MKFSVHESSSSLPSIVSPAYDDSNLNFNHDSSESISPEMEQTFCNDFFCCGSHLADLHELLAHYEEVHCVQDHSGINLHSTNNKASTLRSPIPQPSTASIEIEFASLKNAGLKNFSINSSDSNASSPFINDTDNSHVKTENNRECSAFDNTIVRRSASSLSAMYGLKNDPALFSESVNTGSTFKNSNGGVSLDDSQLSHSLLSMANAAALSKFKPFSSLGYQNSNVNGLYSLNFQVSKSAIAANNANSSYLELNTENIGRSDRPYVCNVPGCGKTYKNPNGLKYHTIHGHGLSSKDSDKPHRCTFYGCGKRYKNPNGLKYHVAHSHKMQPHHISAASFSSNRMMYPTT